MNHVSRNISEPPPHQNSDVTFYDAGFDSAGAVTEAAKDTFTRRKISVAGSIAYIDSGTELYNQFKKARLPHNNPSMSTTANLISTHKAAIADSIRDIERLVIIGAGSYDSIMNQELVILKEIFGKTNKSKIGEIVLVDVSTDSLKQSVQAIEKVSLEIGARFRTLAIRADYKDISGKSFDNILAAWDAKAREKIKAAVIMTGGTFGNLENLSSTEAFPVHDIDLQMAMIGEFVGEGSQCCLIILQS